jgi:hypothetical protein
VLRRWLTPSGSVSLPVRGTPSLVQFLFEPIGPVAESLDPLLQAIVVVLQAVALTSQPVYLAIRRVRGRRLIVGRTHAPVAPESRAQHK